jgi:hypothetical protein
VKPTDKKWDFDYERAQQMKLELIRKTESETEVNKYLEENLTNSDFRRELILKAIREKAYSKAITLAEAGIVADQKDKPGLVDELEKAEAMVNSQLTNGITYSDNNNIRGMLQVNRKLGNKGRNITFRVDAKYTDNDSKSISLNNAKLYLVQTAEGKDSTYQTNRYNLTPSKNYSYAGQLTYSEPLWKATFLQFSYKFTYSYSKSDRQTDSGNYPNHGTPDHHS